QHTHSFPTRRSSDLSKSIHGLPEYAREGDAGMDIRWAASTDVSKVLKPLERLAFHTGIYVELPEGYEFQIRPRSGLSFKHGLTVLNSPGTIDSNFRGEIKVILVNLSNEAVTIHGGDRIAQMVLAKVGHVDWEN